MSARQHTYFAGDLPYLVERAAIGTPAANQHIVAENALAQPFERAISEFVLLVVFLRNTGHDIGPAPGHQAVAFKLRVLLRVQRVAQSLAVFLGDFLVK